MVTPGSNKDVPPPGSGRRRVAGIAGGLALIGLAIFLVAHAADLARFNELLDRAAPGWLAVAVFCQFLTYLSIATGWRLVLARSHAAQPLRRLVPIAVAKLFADQMLPTAGLSGNVLLVDRLIAIGAPRAAAVGALLTSMIGYYLAYALLALAMLGTLWLHRDATPLLVGLITTFLLVAIAVPALALWLRHRGSRPLPPRLERIELVASLIRLVGEAPSALLRDRRLLTAVAALNGAVFICDTMTLMACLWALGFPVAPSTAFVAVIGASIVVTLGPIPFGLGTYETASVALLHTLAVPVEPALGGTLLFRLLTLWLPLLPGAVLMRPGRRRRRASGFKR